MKKKTVEYQVQLLFGNTWTTSIYSKPNMTKKQAVKIAKKSTASIDEYRAVRITTEVL